MLAVSCSGNEPEPEEPAVALELDKYWNTIGPWEDNIDSFEITSGNGGYELVYPKSISLYNDPQAGGISELVETVSYPDYLDSIFSLRVDDNDNIVVEVDMQEYRVGMTYFMIKDAKGKRAVFEVHHFPEGMPVGGPHSDDMSFERPEYPPVDYWVNY